MMKTITFVYLVLMVQRTNRHGQNVFTEHSQSNVWFLLSRFFFREVKLNVFCTTIAHECFMNDRILRTHTHTHSTDGLRADKCLMKNACQ